MSVYRIQDGIMKWIAAAFAQQSVAECTYHLLIPKSVILSEVVNLMQTW